MTARRVCLALIMLLLATGLSVSAQPHDIHPHIEGSPAHRLGPPARYSPDELAAILHHASHRPLPPDPTNRVADDPHAAVLGRLLFFNRRFSSSRRVACATCHRPARAFTDGRALARGIAIGTRNTPTIINAAFNRWFFWDGRSDSLWSQALQQLEDPRACGGDRLHIVHIVLRDPTLRKAYRKVFGKLPQLADAMRFPGHARPDVDPRAAVARAWKVMTVLDQTTINRIFSNLGKAIEAYERMLVSYGSPFDRYVAELKTGKKAAGRRVISAAARRGLKLFVGKAKCDLCHFGPNFTDGRFHDLGLPLLPGESEDPGREAGIRRLVRDRFNGKGRFSDVINRESGDRFAFLPPAQSQLGAFKTPSLRNVALTAPYMHDGRFSTLNQVLNFYTENAAAGRGRLVGNRDKTLDLIPHLTRRQKADIIAFLRTLTSAPLHSGLRRAPLPQP